jgi:hypothetical protein
MRTPSAAALLVLMVARPASAQAPEAAAPRANPFACLGEGESLVRGVSTAEIRAEIATRVAHPPPADESAFDRARHHCVTAELMRRVGDGRAADYYEKAIAANPTEPGFELWYGYYLRNVRGPRAPLLEQAELHYFSALDKMRAVRAANAAADFDDITESWVRRGLMSLYQEDGLPLLRSKAFPYAANGAGSLGASLTSMARVSHDTNEFGGIDDGRRYAAEAAFSSSRQRLNRPLDREELRGIIRTPIRYSLYNRLRLRIPYLGAVDALYNRFRAPSSQITAFTEPNTFVDVAVDEFGGAWKRAFDLYPLFDLLLDLGYRRVQRRGVIEWYKDQRETLNLIEARPAVSRFLGPDKLTVGMNYVFMDIPELPNGAVSDRKRGRAIRAFYADYAMYRPLLLPDLSTLELRRTPTRGFHFYGGYAMDDEVYGVRMVQRRDLYAGTSLRGLGGFDVTLQGTIFTSNTMESRWENGVLERVLDGSQGIRQLRPTMILLYRLIDDEAIPDVPRSPLAGLNLVVPVRADFATEGPRDFENLRGGVELWGKVIATPLRGTHFLITAGYEAQWFHRLDRVLHIGRLELRMGWSYL